METMTTLQNAGELYNERSPYVMPAPNQVRFITGGQTINLVMGSCISTVFIGRNSRYVAAANHIMIARRRSDGVIATRDARDQIDEMLEMYREKFNIGAGDLRCLHLVGGGRKTNDESFMIHLENISETRAILEEKGMDVMFDDTRSHYFASYSLADGMVSVFIEDQLAGVHLSYIIDLDRLFTLDPKLVTGLPASALKPENAGFEGLIERGVITFITGQRDRPDL